MPLWSHTVIERMTNILESDTKLSIEQCDNINNCLLLLRNVLHIPETNTTYQNVIIWNLFTQSFDKLLLHLMTCPQKAYWSVTVVQMIALLYKDQQFSTLQKLLNAWFEASLSESSGDNESNTSPSKPSSPMLNSSSPMLTSDPTSDSSDTGHTNKMESYCSNSFISDRFILGSGNKIGEIGTKTSVSQNSDNNFQNTVIRVKAFGKKSSQLSLCTDDSIDDMSSSDRRRSSGFGSIDEQSLFNSDDQKTNNGDSTTNENAPISSNVNAPQNNTSSSSSGDSASTHLDKAKKFQQNNSILLKNNKKTQIIKQEVSDCGYGTQIENQESISTSSNDDDFPNQKIHKKPPPNQKQRFNAANKLRKSTSAQDKKELRRKKLVKRSRCSIINMKGMADYNPTDEDISNVLKEFTVDFLLKGYRFLVQELHSQLLKNVDLEIDTSHFFWLITYFLKFSAQLELDIKHIDSVLCYEILSYLTYEGVKICEQIQLDSKVPETDLSPSIRRIHLDITAIREFIYSLDVYNKSTSLINEDKEYLKALRIRIANTNDLKCLFVLLLRTYMPHLHSRQYLQDLVTTNHQLLLLMDDVSKMPENQCNIKLSTNDVMIEHIKQFASVDIMYHYGLLLENFRENGEYVNDCIFTMMHHVGGDLEQVSILFQPNILKTFSSIWQSQYSIADDWSDLIEFVIHKFINTPQQVPTSLPNVPMLVKTRPNSSTPSILETDAIDNLYWYYVQSKFCNDVVGNIIKLFQTSFEKHPTRIEVIQQLHRQDIISSTEFDKLMSFEDSDYDQKNRRQSDFSCTDSGICTKDEEKPFDDINALVEQLIKEDKLKIIKWLQHILMECCFIKLKLEPQDIPLMEDSGIIMEPVAYHCILKNQSIPIVPWNSEQVMSLVHQPFILLLHKLGFHLPNDTNKIYVRIPNFWTADALFTIAEKLGPIDESVLKFNLSHFNQIRKSDIETTQEQESHLLSSSMFCTPRLHKVQSIIRYTPTPNQSWLKELEPVMQELLIVDEMKVDSKQQSKALTDGGSIIKTECLEETQQMESLSLEIPSTNLSWIQDIVRAKAGTLDGLLPRDYSTPNGHILNSEQLLMLVRGDTPMFSVNSERTTTDIISTKKITETESESIVFSTAKSELDQIAETNEDTNCSMNESKNIENKPVLRSRILHTVAEEHEIVSACDAASVFSDLMYVSDEEDKHSVEMQISSDL